MPPHAQATYMKDLPSAIASPAMGSNAPLATSVFPLARPYPMAKASPSSKRDLPMGKAYPLAMAKAKPKKKRSPPSTCAKRAKGDCSPPTCAWASGPKKQYCTLSRKKSGPATPRKSPKKKKSRPTTPKKSPPSSPKKSPAKPVYYQLIHELD